MNFLKRCEFFLCLIQLYIIEGSTLVIFLNSKLLRAKLRRRHGEYSARDGHMFAYIYGVTDLIVAMNGFRNTLTRVGWVRPVRHEKSSRPRSIGPHDRPVRAHARTSPRVKRLLRLSRCDLRRSFKTYDERDVVGLGARARAGGCLPRASSRALARGKLSVSEGAKPGVLSRPSITRRSPDGC